MIRFNPQMIFISAGFDAHINDPLSSSELTNEDFQWATDIAVQAAYTINPIEVPPIVSSLEGGYNLKAIAESALLHVQSLANASNIVKEQANYSTTDLLNVRQ